MNEQPETWGDVAKALAVGALLAVAVILLAHAVAAVQP